MQPPRITINEACFGLFIKTIVLRKVTSNINRSVRTLTIVLSFSVRLCSRRPPRSIYYYTTLTLRRVVGNRKRAGGFGVLFRSKSPASRSNPETGGKSLGTLRVPCGWRIPNQSRKSPFLCTRVLRNLCLIKRVSWASWDLPARCTRLQREAVGIPTT
jgi:hypothetical protein